MMKTESALEFVKRKASLLNDTCFTNKLDIETMVCSALSLSKAKLYADLSSISESQKESICSMIDRRELGEPLAYILGEKGFWDINLKVDKHVLVPRPETETIISAVLDLYNHEYKKVLDLGTGSGALALSLANARKQWEIYATDISFQALKVAKHNQDNLKKKVFLIQSSWFEAFKKESFDLIVSNPPYIGSADKRLKDDGLRFEPKVALVSGETGLQDLIEICINSFSFLKPGGRIFLEHSPSQENFIKEQCLMSGYTKVKPLKDLNGDVRVTMAFKV